METVVGTEFTTPRLTKTFERSFKMSSEYIKHNGQKVKKSSVMSRNKKYRYNKSGSLEEVTDEATLTADDFVISGSKSTLRRISDIEQNVAMIYTRLTTSDGSSETATSEDSDDVAVGKSGKTTRFKGDVKFEGGIDISSSRWSNNVSTNFADAVVNKSNAYTNVSVSNDTLTFTTGEGNTKSVSISDANTWRGVVDNLTSTSTTTSLTANQGRVLKGLITDEASARATAISAEASARASAIATAKAEAISSAISQVTNGASAAFDTLKEIQNAMATDAELSAAINGLTIGNGTLNVAAGNGLTGGGSFSANQTSNVTRTLHVGGGNGISVSADGVAMSGSFTGTFTASGDICAYSDASLKTNVQAIDGALGKVEAVRGVTFDRIADGSTSVGVIAQELEAVLPEAVQTDENGVKMVAYGNVTGLLIEAVKELSAEVKALKGE